MFTYIDEKKNMADNLQKKKKKSLYLLCMLFAFLSGGSDDLSIKEVKNTIFLKFLLENTENNYIFQNTFSEYIHVNYTETTI